jgi:hypothetical protein
LRGVSQVSERAGSDSARWLDERCD